MAYGYRELDFNGVVKYKSELAAIKSKDKNTARAEAANMFTEMVTASLNQWFNWTISSLVESHSQTVAQLDEAIRTAEDLLRNYMQILSTNPDYLRVKFKVTYQTFNIQLKSYNIPTAFMVSAVLTKSKGWIYFE